VIGIEKISTQRRKDAKGAKDLCIKFLNSYWRDTLTVFSPKEILRPLRLRVEGLN